MLHDNDDLLLRIVRYSLHKLNSLIAYPIYSIVDEDKEPLKRRHIVEYRRLQPV